MIEEVPKKVTPTDALIAAMEQAEEMEDVIIIFSIKGSTKYGTEDSDVSLERSLWMVKMFEQWLYRTVLPER